MHFWIDTHSQCVYTDRYRVPHLCMQGGREGGCARALLLEVARSGARASMATPVHRFATVGYPPRPRRSHRHQSPPVPAVHTSSRRQNDASFVDIAVERRRPTMTSLATAPSVTRDTLVRSTAFGLHRSPIMARHLKFATLVFIALTIILLAVIKYGFDRQVARECHNKSPRSEQTVVSGAVVCVVVACACAVGVGCALSLCRAAPSAPARALPAGVTSTAAHPQQQQSSEPSEDIEAPPTPRPESPEAPPPYKIAVLMPGRESPPPPAYSELS